MCISIVTKHKYIELLALMIWPIDREQLITRPPVYKKSEV